MHVTSVTVATFPSKLEHTSIVSSAKIKRLFEDALKSAFFLK